MPIKSFRGRLANEGIDTIHLHTNTGSTGYKIHKFELLGPNGNTNTEHVVKIYKIPQTTATTDIDFSDNTVLAAAIYNDTNDPHYFAGSTIIFDNEVFNQDIYITSKGHDNTSDINYYIELEQVKLDITENSVATLRDIRTISRNSA